MIKISWLDRVKKNQKYYVESRRKGLSYVQYKEGRLTGFVHRNCYLKHVSEGEVEGTQRRGIRRNQLLDDFKEKGRHWILKDEAVDFKLMVPCIITQY